MIAPHILTAIRSAVNLQALAAEYVPLKKAGNQFLTRCLWHNDSSPSLRLYEDHYFCFVCQAKGSPIDWLMQMEDTSFRGAVELLAERTGISLDGPKVTRAQLGYARQEAEFCLWWWAQKQKMLSTLVESALTNEDYELLDSLASINRWHRTITAPQKFSIFQKSRTDQDRKNWDWSVKAETELRNGLMTLWVESMAPDRAA